MKILKLVSVLLVSTIAIVGCKKSESKPACSQGKVNNEDNSNGNEITGKITVISIDGDKGTTIVGSGDDDRDGGDKKAKKALR
jgi:hypothetical protein